MISMKSRWARIESCEESLGKGEFRHFDRLLASVVKQCHIVMDVLGLADKATTPVLSQMLKIISIRSKVKIEELLNRLKEWEGLLLIQQTKWELEDG